MFVGAETVAGVGFDAARVRLANLTQGGWLADASGQSFQELGQELARVGPAPGVTKLVEVRFGEMATRGRLVLLPVRWHAAGAGERLFPVMDADLTMSPYRESATLIALTGAYRPPLGLVGAALDRVALRRVASATVRRFVDRIGRAAADPAGATARTAVSHERGVWQFPGVRPSPYGNRT